MPDDLALIRASRHIHDAVTEYTRAIARAETADAVWRIVEAADNLESAVNAIMRAALARHRTLITTDRKEHTHVTD